MRLDEGKMVTMVCTKCGEIINMRPDWDKGDIERAAKEQCVTSCNHNFIFATYAEIKQSIKDRKNAPKMEDILRDVIMLHRMLDTLEKTN